MDKIYKPRSGVDRRIHEAEPPGTHERRRSVEHRKPLVTEVSFEEWEALMRKANRPAVFSSLPDTEPYDWSSVSSRE